jgi:ABC-type Fe3+/spermidine/putrescine transport system ATPase subunit
MTEFLSCRGLRKEFDGERVLNDVDLTVARGECVVLLGPSGCGKTTLLNIVSGLLEADGGELRCNGRVLDDAAAGIHVPMQRRGFAMVFQDFSLWPHMSVADNVGFGLRMLGMSRRDRQQRVREVLRQVQMEAFIDRLPGHLSGGQQQRVAIARALAVRPRVLLLDEPLSALDARLREDLKHELATLLRETDLTAVYVTHDQQEAFTLGDRIALMHGGRLVQVDTPEMLYREPANSFVAGFIGNSNLVQYQRRNGHVLLDGDLAVTLPAGEAPMAGRFMLRRESICVCQDDSCMNGDGWVSLPATCEQTHFLGDHEEAFVRLGNGLRLRGLARGGVREGQQVHVRFPQQAVRFLAD